MANGEMSNVTHTFADDGASCRLRDPEISNLNLLAGSSNSPPGTQPTWVLLFCGLCAGPRQKSTEDWVKTFSAELIE
jgi:hypothetical protein